MSRIMALKDIKPELVDRRSKTQSDRPDPMVTTFFKSTVDKPRTPNAIMGRYPAGEAIVSSPHFHAVNQFQVIVEGSGTFGRHAVAPYCIHYSRAFTRYGPLVSDTKTGWAYMVLRSRYDAGSQRDVEKLKQIEGRSPWQVTAQVSFPPEGAGVGMLDVPEIGSEEDEGLFAATLTMAAGMSTVAPDPSGGDGQYLLVVKGSIVQEDNERQAPVVVFTEAGEPAFEIRAGAKGLQAIIMNLPKVADRPAAVKAQGERSGFHQWQCELCSFSYDEAAGLPGEFIPAGTCWDDVPESWSCPDCAAGKSDFKMLGD